MARRALVLALFMVLGFPAATLAQGSFERVAEGLDFASNVAFAPDGTAYVTEKDRGQILVLRDGRVLDTPFATIPVLVTVNETGLLGIAVDPGFPAEPWIYAYYTDRDLGVNRLVRIRAEGDVGVEVEPLLDLVPVTGFHNGGDLAFGPDGKLYVVTGEGQQPERAQDLESLGGKVLRLNPDGSIPADNPFGPDSPVYALGIRNSFGLCFDPITGELWETENGPDRLDEVNRIEAGANHGWPVRLGPGGEPTYVDPVLAFEEVVVPTGCTVTEDGSALYFGTYGGRIHRLSLPPGEEPRIEVVASTGAVTDVARAPDGSIWVVTSDAIYRSEGVTPDGSPSRPVDGTGATGASAPPRPVADGSSLSPAAIVVGLVLLGGLLLLRSRMGQR